MSSGCHVWKGIFHLQFVISREIITVEREETDLGIATGTQFMNSEEPRQERVASGIRTFEIHWERDIESVFGSRPLSNGQISRMISLNYEIMSWTHGFRLISRCLSLEIPVFLRDMLSSHRERSTDFVSEPIDPMSARSPSRIHHLDGFQIFLGVAKSCPVYVEPWIKQFCSQPQYSWYCEVDIDYASDWFNHYGLKELIDDYFDEALELICDTRSKRWLKLDEQKIEAIHEQAINLYGLLHARWILQPHGLSLMKEKFQTGTFGQCPRLHCDDQQMLPIGETQIPNKHSAKLFCPRCLDLYRPEGISVDGAHFGTTFPHLFLVEYPQFNNRGNFRELEPKIFGFAKFGRGKFQPHALEGPKLEESDE
jgi:casein kinase II subunit beta